MKEYTGFLLIELIIGMAIAGAISLILMNALYQINRSRDKIDDYIYVYTNAALIQNQLERDLTAAFAPDLIAIKKNEPKNQITTKESPEKKSENSQKNELEQNKTEKKEESSEKVFYGSQTNGNIDILTCITTSPLLTYWGTKTGRPKARIARVIYRLIQDPKAANAYILYRQEGQNIDFQSYNTEPTNQNTNAHNYILAKDIKACVITYEMVEETENLSADKSQSNKDQSNNTENKKLTYKNMNEWPPASSTLARLPNAIMVDLTLWNRKHTHETSFIFLYPISWHDTIKKQPINNASREQLNKSLQNKIAFRKKI